jgi:hypothetical protein
MLLRSRYGLGADAPEQTFENTERATASLKKGMVEAVVQTAVAQTAASTAAEVATQGVAITAAMAAGSVIPIVGWALSIAIAIGTMIGAAKAKRDIAKILADVQTQLKAYGDQTQASIKTAQDQVAQQELPAAQQLADSGQPIAGLGGIFDKSFWTKAVTATVLKPVEYVGKAGLAAAKAGANLVGDKRSAAFIAKQQQNWDDNSARVQDMLNRRLQNPYTSIAHDLDAAGRTLAGTQVTHVVRQKAAQLLAAAKKDMDGFRDKMLGLVQTDDYHTNVRTNLAKGLRGDPQFAAQVQELQGRNAMLAATMTSSAQTNDVIQAASTTPPAASSPLSKVAIIAGILLAL